MNVAARRMRVAPGIARGKIESLLRKRSRDNCCRVLAHIMTNQAYAHQHHQRMGMVTW